MSLLDSIPGLYSRAEIYITLSEAEAFGITMLEALQNNCKIVCSSIPAYLELAEKFPEFVFPVPMQASPEEIAQIIRQVHSKPRASSPDLRNYYWPQIAKEHLAVFNQAKNLRKINK